MRKIRVIALREFLAAVRTKAFLLTLRFFCQNNEPTSLCNMEDRVSGLAIDAELKANFRKSRSNFNAFLDGQPSVSFPSGSGADTRRDIFNSFVYGCSININSSNNINMID